MKISLPENYIAKYINCQEVPPRKINSLKNLKIIYENVQNYGST